MYVRAEMIWYLVFVMHIFARKQIEGQGKEMCQSPDKLLHLCGEHLQVDHLSVPLKNV